MTRPLQRRRDGTAEEAEALAAPPAQPTSAEQLLALQRGAGNAAVAGALARQPTADAPVLGGLPTFGTGSPLNRPLYVPPRLKPEVESAVVAWLKTHAATWTAPGFGMTMPEAIDQVRRSVPEAADGDVSAIADVIRGTVGNLPATRANASLGQQAAQQRASISNSFPTPPTSVTVGNAQTYVKIELVGAELRVPHLKVKADKEGAEAEVEAGKTKLGVSGKWDGSEFGLKAGSDGGVKFGGKVHKKGDGWGWSGGLIIPIWGEEVDELPDVGGTVGAAHTAIVDSVTHLAGGGSLTDGFVAGRMGQVKPAFDALGEVAARKAKTGATLRVTAQGDSSGWYAGVSFVVSF